MAEWSHDEERQDDSDHGAAERRVRGGIIGCDAEIPALKREFGFSPLTLEQWAERLAT